MSPTLFPRDYTYCKGEGCSCCDKCWRYVQGNSLPEGNWWWMMNCQNQNEFISIDEV